MGDTSIDELIAALADPMGARAEADAELRRRGRAVVPQLVAALRLATTHRYARAGAADLLGRIGDLAAIDVLIECVSDPDPSVRVSAVESLKRLRSPQSADALLGALRDDEGAIRRVAAIAVARLLKKRALAHLAPLLADPAGFVAEEACQQLARLGTLEAGPYLARALLNHADTNVRLKAAEGAYHVREATLLNALATVVDDPDVGVWAQHIARSIAAAEREQ